MIGDAIDVINDQVYQWGVAALELLPNILLAGVILFFTFFIASKTRRIVHHYVKRSDLKDTLNTLLSTVSYIVVFLLGSFIVLEILSLDKAVTSVLAGAGILGLALAFAFQDIASNFMAGVILATNTVFKVGDLIETNDFFGSVEAIDLRTTTIKTTSGQTVEIPNSSILSNPLTNYSKTEQRRVDIECGVSYDDDLEAARDIAVNAVEQMDWVDERGVEVFYTEFGGSSINFVLRFWIDFGKKNKEYLAAQSDAIEAIKTAFDEEGIDIPFPIRTIDVNDTTASALRGHE